MSSTANLNVSPACANDRRSVLAGVPWAASAFLALTAVISLLWSSCKLLWWDEFLVLWTDGVPGIGQVVHIQRTCPISLDPLTYHLMAHAAIRLFGAGAFAIRMPSLLGYLIMQICLFLFVRRIATERAALFALAFPSVTASLFYSVEGRPYGLMLGLYGIAMVSWQAATRRETNRALPLVTLALAIALTVNAHYYGILLLVPLCAAELFRSCRRRRLDIPILTSIAVGAGGIVFTPPFIAAADEFRSHYHNLNSVKPQLIADAYVAMLTNRPLTHQELTKNALSALTLTPEIKSVLIASPTKQIYFQNTGEFARASYYASDPLIRSRMALVYSRDREFHWDHMDTASLTDIHMRNFTHFNIEPYESVATQSGDQIFVDYRGLWNWIDQSIATSQANVTSVGSAFGGEVLSVRFLP